MRPAAFLVLILCTLPACVPTADFTALRKEVRLVKDENRKLKETEAELRKRLDEQEQILKSAKWVTQQDLQGIKITQQAFDQRLGELGKQAEETSRRVESLAARPEDTDTRSRAKGPMRDPKADTPPGKQNRPEGLESSTVLTPTAAYNLAYNDYLKGNYDLAVAGFESFLQQFPATSLTAHAQYWIGESYYNKKEYRQALDAYKRVLDDPRKNDKIPAALLKSGSANLELGDPAKARSLFKRVIEEYPQSNEATLAKQKLADLR